MSRIQKSQNLGKRAEACVNRLLLQQGWHILARNFRQIGSEIDIIAQKGYTIVFVEVKFRHRKPTTAQDMFEIMPKRKRQALVRGAKYFLQKNEKKLAQWKNLRFDLALVTLAPKSKDKGDIYYLPNI